MAAPSCALLQQVLCHQKMNKTALPVTVTTLASPTQSQDQEATSQPSRMLAGANFPTHWIAEAFPLPAALTDYQALSAEHRPRQARSLNPLSCTNVKFSMDECVMKPAEHHGIPCFAINFENTHEGIAAAGSKEALDRAARNYLVQKNIVRRHYAQGQRAAISDAVGNHASGGPQRISRGSRRRQRTLGQKAKHFALEPASQLSQSIVEAMKEVNMKGRGHPRRFSSSQIADDLQLELRTCKQKKVAVRNVAMKHGCSIDTVYRLNRKERERTVSQLVHRPEITE